MAPAGHHHLPTTTAVHNASQCAECARNNGCNGNGNDHDSGRSGDDPTSSSSCKKARKSPAASKRYQHIRLRRFKEDTMEVDANANEVIDVLGSKCTGAASEQLTDRSRHNRGATTMAGGFCCYIL